jgi:hypothetical protein
MTTIQKPKRSHSRKAPEPPVQPPSSVKEAVTRTSITQFIDSLVPDELMELNTQLKIRNDEAIGRALHCLAVESDYNLRLANDLRRKLDASAAEVVTLQGELNEAKDMAIIEHNRRVTKKHD